MLATPVNEKYTIGRGAYALRFFLVSMLATAIDASLTDPVTGLYEPGAPAFMLVVWIAACWYLVYISMGRCRHIGISPWHSLWILLPFAWIVLAIRKPKDATIVELVRS